MAKNDSNRSLVQTRLHPFLTLGGGELNKTLQIGMQQAFLKQIYFIFMFEKKLINLYNKVCTQSLPII